MLCASVFFIYIHRAHWLLQVLVIAWPEGLLEKTTLL